MALEKTDLKTTIVALMTEMLTKEDNAIDEFATKLSDAIDVYVKSGTVNVTVNTTGSAASQTGTGTGTIS